MTNFLQQTSICRVQSSEVHHTAVEDEEWNREKQLEHPESSCEAHESEDASCEDELLLSVG